MNLHTFLRESTWGYPIIAAIHVLGMACFAGTILVGQYRAELKALRRMGLGVVLASGALLFWLHPVMYFNSVSFRIKMLLLVALIWAKPGTPVTFLLWLAVIFAARGIAFW